MTDPANTPGALDLLAGIGLRCVRLRRLTGHEQDRRDRLRGEPVYAPLRFDLAEIPGETFDQWHERAITAARLASPRYLSPEEAAAELRALEEAELRPVCIGITSTGGSERKKDPTGVCVAWAYFST